MRWSLFSIAWPLAAVVLVSCAPANTSGPPVGRFSAQQQPSEEGTRDPFGRSGSPSRAAPASEHVGTIGTAASEGEAVGDPVVGADGIIQNPNRLSGDGQVDSEPAHDDGGADEAPDPPEPMGDSTADDFAFDGGGDDSGDDSSDE